jgi:hypothetical protein
MACTTHSLPPTYPPDILKQLHCLVELITLLHLNKQIRNSKHQSNAVYARTILASLYAVRIH